MTMFNRFMFGGDWNPEQWPEDTWEHDIWLLERAHINEATINVFSWALLQPDEQTYDFSMLDRIIDLLVRHRFAIVLATGTAAIPAWIARDYPQVMRTGADGTHQVVGGRHKSGLTPPAVRRPPPPPPPPPRGDPRAGSFPATPGAPGRPEQWAG